MPVSDSNYDSKEKQNKKFPPLMCFTHLPIYERMAKQLNLPVLDNNLILPNTFKIFIESWTSDEILKWFEGIGSFVNPWISILEKHIFSGTHLLIIDEDYLERIGVETIKARRMIYKSIQLLIQSISELCNENFQMLTMNVRVATVALLLETKTYQKTSQIIHLKREEISNLQNCANKLIFWLDRSPFDKIKCYAKFRIQLLTETIQLLQIFNFPPAINANNFNDIMKKAFDLRDQCDIMLRSCNDPLINSVSNIKKIFLQRSDSTISWGLHLTSYLGKHVISNIEIESAADCKKISAGDEVLMINARTVIGWKISEVMKILERDNYDLTLLLRKMPKYDLYLKKSLPNDQVPRKLIIPSHESLINFSFEDEDF